MTRQRRRAPRPTTTPAVETPLAASAGPAIAIPDAADPVAAAEAGVLALRPAGAWRDDERAMVRTLATRMVELAGIEATLAAEGLTVVRNGQVRPHPLTPLRTNVERAIARARRVLRLDTTTGEAQRHGRRLAERSNDVGMDPDGTPSLALVFARDPDGLLARPVDHDDSEETALRARLLAAGEIDATGATRPGGRLFAAGLR